MGSIVKNRHRLKSRDIRNIINDLKKSFNCNFFNEKSLVEVGFFNDTKMILVDKIPCFFYYEDTIFFTLQGLNIYKPSNKFIVVDMGAVKFVTNGADIMTPGIKEFDDEIKENDQVWICDEKNRKPLSVGISLLSAEEMSKKEKGKAVKNIHYVGDSLWNLVYSD